MVDAGLGAVAHRTSTEGAGSKLTFRCSCGKAFKLAHASQAYAFEGGDPRDCKALILRAVDHNERLGSQDTRRALVLGAIERALGLWKPPATLTPPERTTTPEPPRAERAPEGGGRVSRPPQSARSQPEPSNLVGHASRQDRLCLTDPLASSPSDTRTVSGRLAALGHASRTAADDTSPSPRGVADAGADTSPAAAEPSSSSRALSDALPGCLLWNAMDTLEVSWKDVDMDPAELERAEAHKKTVQAMSGDGPEAEFRFGGQLWEMRPSGSRHFQFFLKCELGEVAISKHGKTPLLFKFFSETLHRLGLDASWAWMKKIVDRVHAPEGASEESSEQPKVPQPAISREDLCADFQGLPFELAHLEEYVCRPRSKAVWKKLEEGWKRRPLPPEEDDKHAARFVSGLKTTGLTFGRGQMSVRIYDKTKEIKDKSPDKVWLYGFWMRCAACGARANEHETVLHPSEEGAKESTAKRRTVMSEKGSEAGYGACEKTGCESFVVDEAGFMPERTCASCDGRKTVDAAINCKACRNRTSARHECGACNKTGKTTEPRRCAECSGKGVTADRVWRVETQMRRGALGEFCKGVERTCKTCSGMGEFRSEPRPCKPCKGAGGWECLSCKGTGRKSRGTLECKRCAGSGRAACKRCAGAGSRTPPVRVCRTCQEAEAKAEDKGRGFKIEKPDPRELVDPRAGLVIRDGSRGARNVGEDLVLAIDSLEGLKAARAATWRYAVGGGKGVRAWLAWRVPNEKNPQRSRWALRPEWLSVQRLPEWTDATADEMVRVKKKRAKFKKLLPNVAGGIISLAALRTDHDDSELETVEQVFELVYVELAEFFAKREEQDAAKGLMARLGHRRRLFGAWGARGDLEMVAMRDDVERLTA